MGSQYVKATKEEMNEVCSNEIEKLSRKANRETQKLRDLIKSGDYQNKYREVIESASCARMQLYKLVNFMLYLIPEKEEELF